MMLLCLTSATVTTHRRTHACRMFLLSWSKFLTCAAGTGAAHKGQDTPVLDKRVLAEKHRQNISEAIRQKWADPEYRMRALSGMRSGGISQANPRSSARVRLISLCFALHLCFIIQVASDISELQPLGVLQQIAHASLHNRMLQCMTSQSCTSMWSVCTRATLAHPLAPISSIFASTQRAPT